MRLSAIRSHAATHPHWTRGVLTAGHRAKTMFPLDDPRSRIHSPVILTEFDHQQPANLAALAADRKQPTRQHIHVVVRTPNGNDYGKDLLRQH